MQIGLCMIGLRLTVIGSVGIKVANAALGLGVAIVLAKALQPDGYGIYSFAFVLASMAAMLAKLGLPRLILRETAIAEAEENWPRMRALWRWSTGLTGGLATVLILAVLGACLLLPGDPVQTETILMALPLIPLLAFGEQIAGALRGLRKIIHSQIPELFIRPVLVLLAGLTLGVLLPATPLYAMAGYCVAAAVALAVALIMLRYNRPAGLHTAGIPPDDVLDRRAMLRSAIALALVAGAVQINTYADILILGFFRPAAEVGQYRVAYQASLLAGFGINISMMIASPYFARFHKKGETDKLQHMITRCAQGSLALAVPAALAFIFLGDEIMTLAFGDSYTPAHGPLAVMGVTFVISAYVGPTGLLLNMTGHEDKCARAFLMAAVANIALNLVLIPPFGMMGAAVATLVTHAALKLALQYVIRRDLDLRTAAFHFGK